MGTALVLIAAAIVLALLGLALKALKWMLIIAIVLFVVGLVRGFTARRSSP